MTDRATALEIAALGRRAQNDPGAFVPRRRDEDYVGDYERMDRWQARALNAAIDAFLATAPAPAAVTTPEATTTAPVREEWSIVEARDGQPWPCTIVDGHGRSLLGVHNGTPIVRSRPLAERIVRALGVGGGEPE